MYIQISCSKCSQAIALGQSGVVYTKVVALNELGTFVLECPAGHTSTTVLRTPKHEILYLIASNAILDGYLRDAVLSFHGAMERYFEFALRVIVRTRNVSSASFESAWKLVASQSERQFGAFVLTWLFEGGDSFASVPLATIQKQSHFRNAVVHKGAIPSEADCIAYGKHVAEVIRPIESVLLARHSAAHKDECFALSRRVAEASGEPLTVLSEYSVLESMLSRNASLEHALSRLAEHRRFMGNLPRAGERFISRTIEMIEV